MRSLKLYGAPALSGLTWSWYLLGAFARSFGPFNINLLLSWSNKIVSYKHHFIIACTNFSWHLEGKIAYRWIAAMGGTFAITKLNSGAILGGNLLWEVAFTMIQLLQFCGSRHGPVVFFRFSRRETLWTSTMKWGHTRYREQRFTYTFATQICSSLSKWFIYVFDWLV